MEHASISAAVVGHDQFLARVRAANSTAMPGEWLWGCRRLPKTRPADRSIPRPAGSTTSMARSVARTSSGSRGSIRTRSAATSCANHCSIGRRHLALDGRVARYTEIARADDVVEARVDKLRSDDPEGNVVRAVTVLSASPPTTSRTLGPADPGYPWKALHRNARHGVGNGSALNPRNRRALGSDPSTRTRRRRAGRSSHSRPRSNRPGAGTDRCAVRSNPGRRGRTRLCQLAKRRCNVVVGHNAAVPVTGHALVDLKHRRALHLLGRILAVNARQSRRSVASCRSTRRLAGRRGPQARRLLAQKTAWRGEKAMGIRNNRSRGRCRHRARRGTSSDIYERFLWRRLARGEQHGARGDDARRPGSRRTSIHDVPFLYPTHPPPPARDPAPPPALPCPPANASLPPCTPRPPAPRWTSMRSRGDEDEPDL